MLQGRDHVGLFPFTDFGVRHKVGFIHVLVFNRRRYLRLLWHRHIKPGPVAGAENHGALDHVLEFPDVTGPVMTLQSLDLLLR